MHPFTCEDVEELLAMQVPRAWAEAALGLCGAVEPAIDFILHHDEDMAEIVQRLGRGEPAFPPKPKPVRAWDEESEDEESEDEGAAWTTPAEDKARVPAPYTPATPASSSSSRGGGGGTNNSKHKQATAAATSPGGGGSGSGTRGTDNTKPTTASTVPSSGAEGVQGQGQQGTPAAQGTQGGPISKLKAWLGGRGASSTAKKLKSVADKNATVLATLEHIKKCKV